MGDDTEWGISVEDSQLVALQTTPAVAQKNNQQEAETQQDEPTSSLADEPEQDRTLPQVVEDRHPATKLDDNFQKVLSDFLQDLQQKVRTAEEENDELLSYSIRILDSGGQPQFHELMLSSSLGSLGSSLFSSSMNTSQNMERWFYMMKGSQSVTHMSLTTPMSK